MDEQLMKSLVELIDETIAEVEELKKSERFAAAAVKMDGVDGVKMAGQKDANGGMDKAEHDEEDESDEDEKAEDKKEDKKPPFKKGEGENRQADPNGGHHAMAKADEDEKEDDDDEDDDMEKGEGENRQADPNGGHHALAKSLAKTETLMKSYVDGRLAPIEDKLNSLVGMVEKMFKTPMPARAQTHKHVSPLMKSEDAGEPLSKNQVLDALESLQKSGKAVNVSDIVAAEIGGPAELAKIANKYQIKN